MKSHKYQKIALLIGGIFLIAIFPFVLPAYYVGLLTKMIIFALFAMSLDILLGFLGLPSLGHAAFFGIAGYAAAILTVKLGIGPWLSLALGVLIGTGSGAILGLLAIRLKGSYFLMITLAFAQVLWAVALGWRDLTGGDDGLANVPALISGPSGFDQSTVLYFAVAIIVGLSAAVLIRLSRSPFGYALLGIRESEVRMLALGYKVFWYRYVAFVISAAFASVAGALYTFYNMFIGLDSLNIVRSAEVLLMVVMGGAGTLIGPAIGGALIIFLENIISSYTSHWLMCLGLIYVLATLYAPQGLMGLVQSRFKKELE